MIQLPFTSKKNWLTTWGEDGHVHCMPINEDHLPIYWCHCNPVQQYTHGGGLILTHRVLSC